jgi:hypothetical protein
MAKPKTKQKAKDCLKPVIHQKSDGPVNSLIGNACPSVRRTAIGSVNGEVDNYDAQQCNAAEGYRWFVFFRSLLLVRWWWTSYW